MGLISDLKILYHLTLRPVRGKDHASRMESFYGAQAENYDDFRRRLLKGREELWESLPTPENGVWVDMGGGTGSNVSYLADRLDSIGKVYVVDLSSSLLKVAQERFDQQGWSNVKAVEADATTFTPAEGTADVVTFSYSLTMIPDWFAAIDNALRILKPGGLIGTVDFYVSRKYPPQEHRKHRWFTRTLWPTWFANDNVFPCADHVPYLHRRFESVEFVESKCKLPYVPLLRTPFYRFVGRKRDETSLLDSSN